MTKEMLVIGVISLGIIAVAIYIIVMVWKQGKAPPPPPSRGPPLPPVDGGPSF